MKKLSRRCDIHPLANHFPAMEADEFAALREDIRENGQREPIRLYQGKVLDGRHRYKACIDLGLTPKCEPVKFRSDAEAETYCVSQNLQRRHLSKSQQAMILVRAGLVGQNPASGAKRGYRTGDSAIRRISDRYGVSHVSIYKAMYVNRNDKALAQKVLDGKLSVAVAEQMIRDREAPSNAPAYDSRGREIPRGLRQWFADGRKLEATRRDLERAHKQLQDLSVPDGSSAGRLVECLQLAINELESIEPDSICEECAGKGCPSCEGRGWHAVSDRKNEPGNQREESSRRVAGQNLK